MHVVIIRKIEIMEYFRICRKFIEINNLSATNVTNKLKYGIIKRNDVELGFYMEMERIYLFLVGIFVYKCLYFIEK